jgi:hypothetical protein
MTFEDWVAQQPLELVAGSGRYEDMRMTFRIGQVEFRKRVENYVRYTVVESKSAMAYAISQLPVEGDDDV